MKEKHQIILTLHAPETEWSPEFLQAMANRMSVSFYKYGPVNKADKMSPVATAQRCINAYADDGNLEHLVDAANYLQIEFMAPRYPKAHFTPTDSTGSVGRIIDGEVSHANNEGKT